MKALISPNEIQTIIYISAWVDGEPQYTEIEDCQRIAEVTDNAFEVAAPLYWIDCPDDCIADEWYYKDGQLQPKPQNAPQPETNPGE